MSGFLLARLSEGLDKKTPARFCTLHLLRRIGYVKAKRHSTCHEGDVQTVFVDSDINFHPNADTSRLALLHVFCIRV
jgi:hypothetical protein